jgi:hypothetical protein
MRDAQRIAVGVSHMLSDEIEENPVEVFLAFAGLFCSLAIHCNISENDAMNLIKNMYKDVLADAQKEMH